MHADTVGGQCKGLNGAGSVVVAFSGQQALCGLGWCCSSVITFQASRVLARASLQRPPGAPPLLRPPLFMLFAGQHIAVAMLSVLALVHVPAGVGSVYGSLSASLGVPDSQQGRVAAVVCATTARVATVCKSHPPPPRAGTCANVCASLTVWPRPSDSSAPCSPLDLTTPHALCLLSPLHGTTYPRQHLCFLCVLCGSIWPGGYESSGSAGSF